MTTTASPHNSSAEARRDEVIEAAIIEFAERGLYGTSTDDIAMRAGISQPYIFRLFGTKKDLFIAASERICDRITAVFETSASDTGDLPVLHRMGHGFTSLLANRVELLMMLQAFVGTEDADVRAVMQRRMLAMYDLVRRLSGAPEYEVHAFVATGMLLAVLRACDLPQVLNLPSWEAAVQMHDAFDLAPWEAAIHATSVVCPPWVPASPQDPRR